MSTAAEFCTAFYLHEAAECFGFPLMLKSCRCAGLALRVVSRAC